MKLHIMLKVKNRKFFFLQKLCVCADACVCVRVCVHTMFYKSLYFKLLIKSILASVIASFPLIGGMLIGYLDAVLCITSAFSIEVSDLV